MRGWMTAAPHARPVEHTGSSAASRGQNVVGRSRPYGQFRVVLRCRDRAVAMEAHKDTNNLPPVTEDIGLPTPLGSGRPPLLHLPHPNHVEDDTEGERPVPAPHGSEA